jgi:hypothetical protein
MSLKSISSFLASILLISFTISAGIIVYYFVSTLPQTQTQQVSSQASKVLSCAGATFDVKVRNCNLLNGLVLWLPMDEGSGNIVYDYSGNKNNGTYYGYNPHTQSNSTLLYLTGSSPINLTGKALSFDGVDDYTSSRLVDMREYTVSVIFNPNRITDVPTYQDLLGTPSNAYYGAAISLVIRHGALNAIYQDSLHIPAVSLPVSNNWYFAFLVAKKLDFAYLYLYNVSGLVGKSIKSGIDWTGSFSSFNIGANTRGYLFHLMVL